MLCDISQPALQLQHPLQRQTYHLSSVAGVFETPPEIGGRDDSQRLCQHVLRQAAHFVPTRSKSRDRRANDVRLALSVQNLVRNDAREGATHEVTTALWLGKKAARHGEQKLEKVDVEVGITLLDGAFRTLRGSGQLPS